VVLVEDKASGQSLIQELKNDSNLPIVPVKIDSDKTSRAIAVTGIVEAGNWSGVFEWYRQRAEKHEPKISTIPTSGGQPTAALCLSSRASTSALHPRRRCEGSSSAGNRERDSDHHPAAHPRAQWT